MAGMWGPSYGRLLSVRRALPAACCALAVALGMLPARAGEAPSVTDADDQYAVAAGHYAQQRWNFAAEEFQAFLAKYPTHSKRPQGLFFLGETLIQLGRNEEAHQRFEEYLKLSPPGEHARQALFRSGEAAYFANQSAKAKALLTRFLEAHPDDPLNAHALPYLGEISLGEKDYAGAERCFRSGLTRFPQGSLQDDCRFGLARALEKQDQLAEAEKLYLALAGKPASRLAEDSQLRLGAVQYAMGKHAEAAESFGVFEKTWPNSPRQATARLGHGWALLRLDRPAEAAVMFQKITGDAQLGVEARYWLGLARKAQKDWSAAATILAEAAPLAAKHPLEPAIRFHAGDALLRAGDSAAARRQFELVLQTAPAESEWIDDALLGTVQACLRQKDYEAVDRRAGELLSRFPASTHRRDVQRLAARSLIERKQFQKAAEGLEAMLAPGAPGDQGLEERYLLALAYEGLKRYDDALAALKPVLASADGPLKAEALLAQASVQIAGNRFAEAIAPLEAYLAAGPSGDAAIKARGNLAICCARAKQLDKAKRLYGALAEKHAQHESLVPATEQLAEAAYEAGDTAWSNELFARLAKQAAQPDKQLAGLSGLGWSQYKAGKLKEAAATFAQLLARNPDPALGAEASLVRGQILEQIQQSDAALAMYDAVIQRFPAGKELPQALLAAARIRHKLHQDQQAAVLFERLVKEYPKLPEIDSALYEWAWALNDSGKVSEACDAFERLRREHAQSRYWPDATFRLAQNALKAKDYARARQLVDSLLQRAVDPPLRENGLFLRGQIAAGQAEWREARQAFESLIKEFPTGSLRMLADFGLAEAVFRLGEYETAAARFERLGSEAQGRDPAIPAVALLRQAQALCHMKKWSEALQIAARIEGAHPGFAEQYEADYVIGRCLAARADFEGAREAYRRVIRSPGGVKTETAANAQLMIAETHFHQKNYETAVREYLKTEILYAFPTVQAAALLQAGKCHELLGEWKQAEQLYARLVKVYPDAAAAKEGAARQKTLQERNNN